ncbi:HAMP domain-containing sensor histidine kinase [Elizabethkingia sp. JS20170427COW]|uniref:sensor histidine kinase n=1 Tax=Elizabethkingia sp. JS20170427COW TaxID=2583851 RepID=UPI00111086A9|nr:HAMP domain-containing sensor histidine kinase [Elizabethkingia sp. JS20170427COW]QCX52812.1 HAMP domain-containing histidine kinase [Elizabethkingia sp. JS20170427COW]
MFFEVKRRKIILYSLISSILLIQVIVFLFLYNEYFNAQKLSKIEQKIQQSQTFSKLTSDSKKEFSKAQQHLQKYFATKDTQELDLYFSSLNQLAKNLDGFVKYGNKNIEFNQYLRYHQENDNRISSLKNKIDSTQKAYQAHKIEDLPLTIDPLNLKTKEHTLDLKIERKTDSIVKKGLFGRLSDAIKGEQRVKTDTLVITKQNGSTVDLNEINNEIKKIINQANHLYQQKIKNIQQKQVVVQNNYAFQYELFDQLLASSNSLLEAYDLAVDAYKNELDKQYQQQQKKNDNLRYYTIIGLVILMFIVSIIIIYYIRQSFEYEKKLQQANKIIGANLDFKNKIIGMISHEMRAPMQIMNIFIRRVEKNTQDPKVLEYLKSMKFTNNSLLIQSNQILEYSKDINKPATLEKSDFNLKESIDQTLVAFQAFAESRNNQLIIKNNLHDNLIVHSDYTKIYQLLINLLSNANKFTENGSIIADISSEENLQQTLLKVNIQDTGTGIAPEDLEEIFKPYYRGIISDKVENMGVGLGLNLCQQIVDLFGGEISATSQLGKGTSIQFRIPLNNH